MPETTVKQQLQQLLEEGVGRHNYDELIKTIYKSFRSLDQAHGLLEQKEAELAGVSGAKKNELLEQVGIFACAQGQFRKAAEFLEEVKNRKEASHFLGRARIQMGLFQEALEALEKGRRGKGDFETDRFVIDALCSLRKDEDAEKICKSYEKKHSKDPHLIYSRARVMETAGEHARAMELYEQALSIDEKHQNSLFRLAFNCDLNGDDDRALELYEKCASLNPASLGAIINLGILYEDRGEYEKAIDCYEKVLAVEPAHKRARLYLKDADAALHMTFDEDMRFKISQREKILQKPIDELELSSRCRLVLEKKNVKSLGDLTRVSEAELMECNNFGDASLREIKDLMAGFGLCLREEPARLPETNETEDDQVPSKEAE